MIIWSRFGILAPIMLGISFISINSLTTKYFLNPNYYKENWWPDFLAFVMTGTLCFLMGKFLNRKPGKIYVDKETNEEVLVKPYDSFFFIRLEYWGILFPIIGLIKIFYR